MKPKYFKLVIFAACLLPLARLGWKAFNSALGANPIQVITFSTGTWTLVFLLLTLSITPLRKLTKQYWLIQYRRMLGLFAFFYVCLHFTTYIWLDQFFDLHSVYKDIYKRPFITVGFTAFVLMIPLALTSTRWSIRKLGKRWQKLHRLIYFSALAGVVHFLWAVKLDKRVPEIYGSILGVLLLYRVIVWYRGRAISAKIGASASQAQTERVIRQDSKSVARQIA
jgi:sulfoxide reductase heme-binding subunit YedZ